MKRAAILSILTLFMLNSVNLFSQERVSKPIPYIGTKINGQLSKAKGWLLNPEGQWISRSNRIPSFIENEFNLLIDYEYDGLGLDNFISYQFRDIKIQDSTYSIFIKKHKSGFYKYPSIDKGWTACSSVSFYVFKKSEMSKFDSITDNSINMVNINTIYSGYLSWIDNETYISDIQKEIVKLIDEKKVEKEKNEEREIHLVFHIAPYKSKNIVQFQIYSNYSKYNSIGGIIKEHKVKDENGEYSQNENQIYLSDNLFKHCYYEIDYITFNSFIKIKK